MPISTQNNVWMLILPDATISAASVAEQSPRSGRWLVQSPLSWLTAGHVSLPVIDVQHAAVSWLWHHVNTAHWHGILRVTTIVKTGAQHWRIHGLCHQISVAIDKIISVQSWRQFHLVTSRRDHSHLLWCWTGSWSCNPWSSSSWVSSGETLGWNNDYQYLTSKL